MPPAIAFSTQKESEFASFKHGITSETSKGGASPLTSSRAVISVLIAGARFTSKPAPSSIATKSPRGNASHHPLPACILPRRHYDGGVSASHLRLHIV
jgi:hypothetical protein